MSNKIQLRRDTSTNWTRVNPTLSMGEPGYEIDTGKFKIGNGSDSWNSLDYVVGSGGSGSGATGPQGATGNVGATGASGSNGNDGATGASGSNGNDGATGATGMTLFETTTTLINNSYDVYLDNNGILILSTASVILGTGSDPNVYIETVANSTTSTWTFGADGILELPGSLTGDPVVIQGAPVTITITDTGGVWGGALGTYTRLNGITPPKWAPANYNPGSDSSITYDGGWQLNNPSFGHPVYVNTGTLTSPSATWNPDTQFGLGSGNPAGAYTYNAWTFGADGGLTVPGNIKPATIPQVGTIITGIEAYLGGGAPYNYAWNSVGNPNFHSLYNRGSSIIGWTFYTTSNPGAAVTITGIDTAGSVSLGFSGDPGAGPYTAQSPDYAPASTNNLQIEAGSAHNWEFGANGVFYLPNASYIQPNGTSVNWGVQGDFNLLTDDAEDITTKTWTFGANGSLTLPGAINNSTKTTTGSGDPAYPTAIDLTKTVNKLADNLGSTYTLADGHEGQIMYLVPQTGATMTGVNVTVSNGRIINANTSTALVVQNVLLAPFNYSATPVPTIGVTTLIFTDGAWQADAGVWNY